MQNERRHFSGPDKVAILKKHLLEKVPISNLCDEYKLQPTQIYTWIKIFFEQGHAAFENGRADKAAENANKKKIEQLEAKIQRKDSVLAELMEAHTLLKKRFLWLGFIAAQVTFQDVSMSTS